MNRAIKFMLLVITIFAMAISREISVPAKARINGDFVRVRATPTPEGQCVGILYKNMIVTAVDKGPSLVTIGEKSDFWYKITIDNLLGWAFGPFLDFDSISGATDTYTSTLGMEWFFNRFQISTWEYPNIMDISSFTLDEYRALITEISKGYNEPAALTLHYSVYRGIEKKKDEPPFPYLKRKLFSPEFIGAMYQSDRGLFSGLPSEYLDSAAFLMQLTEFNPSIIQYASERLQKDRDFVLQMIKVSSDNIQFSNLSNDEKLIQSALSYLWDAAKRDVKTYSASRSLFLQYVTPDMQAKFKDYTPPQLNATPKKDG
jgi:hypothetical protein